MTKNQLQLITARRKRMKLDAIQPNDATAIFRIRPDQVRLLWSDEWYDEPLGGMAEFNEAKCLFEIIDRDTLGSEDEKRSYWLIQLNADQLNDEEQWHELFPPRLRTKDINGATGSRNRHADDLHGLEGDGLLLQG